MTRTCTCGAGLGPKNKTGNCRSCSARRLNSDPAIMVAREKARAAYFARPGVREGYAQRIGAYIRNMPPEERARRRAQGQWLAKNVLSRPEVRAASNSPEAKAKAGRARSDTVLAWCPPEMRDAYRELVRKNGLPADEARRIIEAEIPGTVEHGRRGLAAQVLKLRLKHERDLREAY